MPAVSPAEGEPPDTAPSPVWRSSAPNAPTCVNPVNSSS